jgi:hypothetical protein
LSRRRRDRSELGRHPSTKYRRTRDRTYARSDRTPDRVRVRGRDPNPTPHCLRLTHSPARAGALPLRRSSGAADVVALHLDRPAVPGAAQAVTNGHVAGLRVRDHDRRARRGCLCCRESSGHDRGHGGGWAAPKGHAHRRGHRHTVRAGLDDVEFLPDFWTDWSSASNQARQLAYSGRPAGRYTWSVMPFG